MIELKRDQPFFVFDVESIGLYGDGFAVGGGVYIDGAAQSEFRYSCPTGQALGSEEDRKWVHGNCPAMLVTHPSTRQLRMAFCEKWAEARRAHPGILMAADVAWPVEANFLLACSCFMTSGEGPYPLIDIASVMFAAGFDPLAEYDRTRSELPKHDPLADARQSARLLAVAVDKLIRLRCIDGWTSCFGIDVQMNRPGQDNQGIKK